MFNTASIMRRVDLQVPVHMEFFKIENLDDLDLRFGNLGFQFVLSSDYKKKYAK